MTTHHDVARQLQMKMSQMRGLIAEESEEAADQTRLALDWKHQLASHPVITAAIAIAVGYWLIPRRQQRAEADSLVEIRSLLENQTRQSTAGSGIGKNLALAAGSMLIKGLANGAVSKAISSFESWRDRSPAEDQVLMGKPNLNTVNEGDSDDD